MRFNESKLPIEDIQPEGDLTKIVLSGAPRGLHEKKKLLEGVLIESGYQIVDNQSTSERFIKIETRPEEGFLEGLMAACGITPEELERSRSRTEQRKLSQRSNQQNFRSL